MNSNINSQLGTALRAARHRRGLTVRQLAEAIGTTPATISRLEIGEIESPRPQHLVALARSLAIDVEDLYAMAGYLMPEGLPELRPYLRSKYGLGDRAVEQLDEYFQALRAGWDIAKEDHHDRGEQPT